MKRHLYTIALFISVISLQAQTLNYTDMGILFSQENILGTARNTGLNGAMGAIGGDISAAQTNPAGAAVFNNGEFTITAGVHNTNNTNNYNGTSNLNKAADLSIDQAGGVLVFTDLNSYSGWNKVALAINYQKTNNFFKRDLFRGNGGFASFNTHPNDEGNEYKNAINQRFYNDYNGDLSKLSFTFAGQYEKNIYLGVGLNFHSLDFTQSTELNEINQDNDGFVLDGLAIQNNYQTADGFSINGGIIVKPIHQIRLGLSAHSPVWYPSVYEEFNSTELIANIPEKNIAAAQPIRNNTFFEYSLRTPGKLTASAALVLGKFGFLNIDYTYKGYQFLNINNATGFHRNDNLYFSAALQNTDNFNVGGEFRLRNLNIRFGAGFKESPFKDGLDPNFVDIIRLGDTYSGSFGMGYRFGNSKLEFAYRQTKQENTFDIYDGSTVNPATINNNNSSLVLGYTYLF